MEIWNQPAFSNHVFGYVFVLGSQTFHRVTGSQPPARPLILPHCGDSCGDAASISFKYCGESLAMLRLQFGPKTADKKSSEDGSCVETTAVIHRTHLNRALAALLGLFRFLGRSAHMWPSAHFRFPDELGQRLILIWCLLRHLRHLRGLRGATTVPSVSTVIALHQGAIGTQANSQGTQRNRRPFTGRRTSEDGQVKRWGIFARVGHLHARCGSLGRDSADDRTPFTTFMRFEVVNHRPVRSFRT